MLAHVFADHLVLRAAVDRRREVGDRVTKARLVRRELVRRTRKAKIDVARFLLEHAAQRRRQRGVRLPDEVATRAVPHRLAVR